MRPFSKVAPDWWDYTTLDPAILNDPAVYTPAEVRSRLYQSAEVSPALERIRTRTWTRVKTAR